MTHPKSRISAGNPRRTAARRRSVSLGSVAVSLMSVFCFLLILRNADAAIAYIGRGLALCVTTVIPTLFPFMVISELLVSSGAGEAFGRIFARLMRWVFGLSGAGVSAVILGSMCGFPVGARTAVSLYDRNMISKSECEHLLTFTSNPSSAFLITAVGLSLFGERAVGVTLYAVVLGSGFLVGFLARFFLRRRGEPAEHPHFPTGFHPFGVKMFTDAVSGAAEGMLTVCAYVVFFSAIMGALGSLPVARVLPEAVYALLCGLLEMTGGISEASGLSSGEAALILAAGLAGWSGLSVHCQVISLCGGRGLSFRPYLVAKAAQGLLAAGIMAILVAIERTQGPVGLLRPEAGAIAPLTGVILAVTSLKNWSPPALLSDGLFLIGMVGARRRS